MKRFLFFSRFFVILVSQSSILNSLCSKASFCIVVYSRAAHNRREKKQFRSNTKSPGIRPYGFVMASFEMLSCPSIPG